MTRSTDTEITIRRLDETDLPRLRRLAGRDSATVPDGELIGAFRSGNLIAATQIRSRSPRTIADPFESTADASALLRIRRRQITAAGRSPARRGRFRSRRRARPAIAA